MSALPRDWHRRRPTTQAELDLMDRCLTAACAEVVAEIEANKAAGILPPSAVRPDDHQFDHDNERDYGWSILEDRPSLYARANTEFAR